MKKIYFEPVTELVELETVGFLASSIGDVDTPGNGGEVTPGDGGDPTQPGWGSDY